MLNVRLRIFRYLNYSGFFFYFLHMCIYQRRSPLARSHGWTSVVRPARTKSHRELSLGDREGNEPSLWLSWSNSLWQGWSCGLVYCPGGNATEPIWRVLACSDGISSWTPLKPQHSNPNPNPFANQLWCIDFLTPPTPLIIPHRLPAFQESLMPLKNWCSIYARWSKSSLKHSIHFCGLFSKCKTEFYCISFF